MKTLILGDPHGILPKNLDSIMEKNKIEIIICTGDIPITPKKPWLEESWEGITEKEILNSYKKILNKLVSYKKPVITLRGNMSVSEIRKNPLRKLFREKKHIYHKINGTFKILGQTFILFDVVYEEFNTRKKSSLKVLGNTKKRKRKLSKMLKENPSAILICHNPPFGYLDEVKNEFSGFKKRHVGSKIILNAIKKYQPKYVFCGHIHEGKGKAKIGKTQVYNVGHAGDYLVLDIE